MPADKCPGRRRVGIVTLAAIPALLFLLASAGCGTTAPRGGSEDLRSRVEGYWQARQRRDLGSMYEFYTPTYRARHPRDGFLGQRRLVRFDVLHFQIATVRVAGDRGEVTVAYRTSLPTIPRPIEAEVTESWIRTADGRWYREPTPLLLPYPDPGGRLRTVED
ncbi:MAG: nuclear transport factor 2 family protein [Candidatus Rokuibacteriota bacterium]